MIKQIISDIKEDWKMQVRDLSDEDLNEDRSYWMKHYGRVYMDDEFKDDDEYDSDIHTLAIEIEQLRRNGKIYYDDRLKPPSKKKPLVKENLMNEIDNDKVTNAFAMFVLSRTDDNVLINSVREFKELFHKQLKRLAKRKMKTNGSDEITQIANKIQIDRDVDTATERSINDLNGMIRNLRLDVNSWKKELQI